MVNGLPISRSLQRGQFHGKAALDLRTVDDLEATLQFRRVTVLQKVNHAERAKRGVRRGDDKPNACDCTLHDGTNKRERIKSRRCFENNTSRVGCIVFFTENQKLNVLGLY